MWSVGTSEPPTQTGSRYMNMLSPTGGLFDNGEISSVPTDLLDLDPDLLSTLSSPPGSIESYDTTSDDAVMMENWQMNEVFQDIPDSEDGGSVDFPVLNEAEDDLDLFVKHVLGDPIPSKDPVILAQPDWTDQSENTEFATEDIIPIDLNLETVVLEAFGSDGLQGYNLLDELESMDSEEPGSSSSSSELAQNSTAAVESDHQYTQLSKIEVKPHETKKQAIRRVKNNAASKVCRKQRKSKFTLNQIKIDELSKTNNELKERLDNVQSIVELLKEHLVKATCKK